MKRIFAFFVLAICLNICCEANAQDKSYDHDSAYLVPNPQTARWSYIETDSNGKQITTIYNSVASIKGDAVNGNLKVRVDEVPVASPKDTTTSFNFYRFKDGEFMVDLYSGFEYSTFDGKSLDSLVCSTVEEKYPNLSEEKKKDVIEKTKSEFIKTSGETRGIPRYPEVGKLPDYEFRFKVSIMSMKVFGKDRKIVGTERIQTEAGVFDCFIMEETITVKVMIMKDVEKTRSWYAYGIGLVKEVTYNENGKLLSTMILNEINW